MIDDGIDLRCSRVMLTTLKPLGVERSNDLYWFHTAVRVAPWKPDMVQTSTLTDLTLANGVIRDRRQSGQGRQPTADTRDGNRLY